MAHSQVNRQAEGGSRLSSSSPLRVRRAMTIVTIPAFPLSKIAIILEKAEKAFIATRLVLQARTIDMDFHAKSTRYRRPIEHSLSNEASLVTTPARIR
jgi:hypothetical protein